MINTSKQWREGVAQPFRGQGYFKFNWFPGMPEISPYAVTRLGVTLGEGSSYDPNKFSAYNGNAFGDEIASLEEGRWLLDGTKHSTHVDNKSTRDMELAPVPGTDYIFRWMGDEPGPSDISNETGTVLRDSGGQAIPRIQPDGSLGPKYYYPMAYNNMGINTDFTFVDDSFAIRTDKIVIIWDPVNKTGPVHFRITLYRNGSSVFNRQITNSGSTMGYAADEWMNEIDLGSTKTFDGLVLAVSSWCRPKSAARVAQIGFGDLITDESEDLLLTGVEMEKASSMLLNENASIKCTLSFDNTSRFLDPLGEKGLIKNIKIGAPFFSRWAMDTLEGEFIQSDPEGWFITGYEVSSDSNEFKLLLGYEGDFINSEYFPDADNETLTPLSPVGIWDWLKDALYFDRKKNVVEPEHHLYPWDVGAALEHSFMYNDDSWAVHFRTTTGYPDVGTVQDTIKSLLQLIGFFVLKSPTSGWMFFKTPQEVDRPITEDNILNSPKIYSDDLVTTIEANKYIVEKKTGSPLYIEVEIKPEKEDVGQELLIPFGQFDLIKGGKKVTCNIIGWPEEVWAATVGAYTTARSGRQGKVRITRVDGDDATAYFHVYGTNGTSVGGGYEYPKKYTFAVSRSSESKVLTVDNKFISSDSWLNDTVKYIKNLVSKPKMIEFSCTGFPELEPGDIVKVYTEYGNYKVLVHSNKVTFNGGFTGTIAGRILEVIE